MVTKEEQNILMMFEEIAEKLDKNTVHLEKIGQKQSEVNTSSNNTTSEEISELKSIFDTFQQEQFEKLDEVESLIRSEKRKIEFTLASMPGLYILFSLAVILVTLSFWIYSLKTQVNDYSDNDLKYRFIQMQGKADSEDFAILDSVFYFDRNSKKIKGLRKQVEAFEENVKQRAKIIEQEERLKKEKDRIEKRLSIKRGEKKQ